MTELEKAARKLCEAVEFDMNGRDGRGGNGGLMSDTTLRACHEVQAILNAPERKDLERDHCVACSRMLEPGDLVYLEHGEVGYICADCTGDDPASFVGEDGDPLKPGDPIPTPFAYE